MKLTSLAAILAALSLLGGCKIVIDVPEGGSVVTDSGDITCSSGEVCEIDVDDTEFEQTFIAEPDEGYAFKGWKKKDRGLCGGNEAPCALTTSGFVGNANLLAILDSDEEFFLEPEFVEFDEFDWVDC